jgi:hypothetical protein
LTASSPAAMPRAAAYSMSLLVRSKKMATFGAALRRGAGWTSDTKNGPHRPDGKPDFP